MTDYVERKISEIIDLDFRKLVTELCQSVDWDEGEFKNKTLANLFTAMVTEDKTPNVKQVLTSRILEQKMKRFAVDSVVYGVCRGLANRRGKPMDDFADGSVFTLIKQCYKAVCPPKPRLQQQGRLQKKHQLETELILRRRHNGSF